MQGAPAAVAGRLLGPAPPATRAPIVASLASVNTAVVAVVAVVADAAPVRITASSVADTGKRLAMLTLVVVGARTGAKGDDGTAGWEREAEAARAARMAARSGGSSRPREGLSVSVSWGSSSSGASWWMASRRSYLGVRRRKVVVCNKIQLKKVRGKKHYCYRQGRRKEIEVATAEKDAEAKAEAQKKQKQKY